MAKGLEAEGFPCVLVEPGPQGAANGVKRGLKNVVCATVEGANFRPGSIGAAGLFDVVEHIEDDVAFLRSLHSLMRPGGRLYLTVPAFQMLWSSEDDYAGHHRRYSTRTLTGSLNKAGFEVEYISYFFWFLTLPVFLLRTLPSFLGLRKQKPAENHAREHSAGSGLVSRVVDGLLDFERGRMRQKKRMPLGGVASRWRGGWRCPSPSTTCGRSGGRLRSATRASGSRAALRSCSHAWGLRCGRPGPRAGPSPSR